MNNSNKEISAYIGLYELNKISKKYLDSLYYTLNKEIQNFDISCKLQVLKWLSGATPAEAPR